ncbi:MAG: hypothetical protein ACP5OA_04755 [Candidatus Woesearchaeota archaeon]
MIEALKLLQYKLELERAEIETGSNREDTGIKKCPEDIHPELRKKDLYSIEYYVPGFIASPADKYMERKGPFARDIDRLSRYMEEIVIEQGKPVVEKLDPYINDGVIGCLHWNKSYKILNCLLEQDVRSTNISINASRYQLLYKLSIAGRERPVNNLVQILQDEWWNVNPFTNKLMNPIIKRYENPNDRSPNDYDSISKLVDELKLVATMGYKGHEKTDWNWIR